MPKQKAKQKAKALLITNPSNITYLSNFTGSSGFMLITQKKSYLFTDFRYIERAKNNIKRGIEIINITKVWQNPRELAQNWQKLLKKHKIDVLGVEKSNLTVIQFEKYKKISKINGKTIKFIDISAQIEEQREIKSKKEIKLIQKSQQINEKVFHEIKKIVQDYYSKSADYRKKNPLREIDLAWKIKELGFSYGAKEVSFDPIVAFGAHSAIPHHEPDKTVLKKGDIVLIDMGMKYQGYCSDMTRTFFTEKPTKEQKHIYDLVLKAQKHAISKIKAGITGKKADELSRKIIEEAGYAENYGHAGGHGIGLDIHESPSLSQNYTKKLKANSVITIEPGIYLEGEFGIRIEDMILVQKRGNKDLTKTKK